jgi:hypothetical protein
MPDLTISKSDFPLWLGGDGTITLHANVPNINQPLPNSAVDLLSIDFGVNGNQPFTFGEANNIKLGIQAGTKARLAIFWPKSSPADTAILADHGLAKYFDSHPDNLILGLLIDANASISAVGTFSYSVLSASTTLDVGGADAYVYLHPYLNSQPFDHIAKDFFGALQLPASVKSSLAAGEVISFDYNGYLKIAAGLSVGYELKGAPSFTIGQLQLSEHYDLSVVGKLSLTAGIAGEFSVEVRSAENLDGSAMAGWVRVIVSKKRTSQFGIAADVNIDASSQLQGLPDTGNEFIGALLGVEAKNWLNLISRIQQLSDFQAIQQELDSLATEFLNEWLGKAFDALSTTAFAGFLQTVKTVVSSYENLDNSAITLFDKYFDKLDTLTSKLNQLAALTSWSQLKGEINNDLWDVVQQLTDGDPLQWILGQVQIPGPNGPVTVPSLQQLTTKVQQTLSLIQNDAHAEIRKVIALAKSSFGLDGFFQQLSQIDSIPKLKALADQKLGGFVERLLGKRADQMSNSELGAAVTRIHHVLSSAENFENNLYTKFKAAANQSVTLALHAEYDRATEQDALIDMFVNVTTDQGKQLIQAAGKGDFQAALAAYQPDLVHLNQGLLSHSITRSSSFSINVVGWHGGWHYQGTDSVIVNTQQQIVPENNAALTVYSTIDMSQERQRQRMGETVLTNLVLRFIGESHGVLAFDKENQDYLIGAITGMAANYELSFADQQTTKAKLRYYLSFASDFGLLEQGATLNNLLPLLPPTSAGADNYGPVTVDYQVRYTETALRRLFSAPLVAASARQIMRKLVLANYVREVDLSNLGWCYWTGGIYDVWKQGQAQFTNHMQLQFSPIDTSPFAQEQAPTSVVLRQDQLRILSTLYYIEDNFIAGHQALDELIHAGQIQPQAFENALGNFGSALKLFENLSTGVNSVFGLFDQLVRQQVPASDARVSSMDLKSTVAGKTVEKVFLAGVALPQTTRVAAAAAAP